jgi:hypothetical protein
MQHATHGARGHGWSSSRCATIVPPHQVACTRAPSFVVSAFGPPRAWLHVCNLQPTPSEMSCGGGCSGTGLWRRSRCFWRSGIRAKSCTRWSPLRKPTPIGSMHPGMLSVRHVHGRPPLCARACACARACEIARLHAHPRVCFQQDSQGRIPLHWAAVRPTPANRSQLHWSAQRAACVATPPGRL